jgi:hypothetical protein
MFLILHTLGSQADRMKLIPLHSPLCTIGRQDPFVASHDLKVLTLMGRFDQPPRPNPTTATITPY